MSEAPSDDGEDDPWLTVADVAAELRLNPATIRLWISKGQLPATRSGRRKLLIRRSDLDRTVAIFQSDDLGPAFLPPAGATWEIRRPPPMSRTHVSRTDSADLRAEPGELERIVDGIQAADEAWRSAQAASENAPPDAGFPHRLRALAEACEEQRFWLVRGAATKGFEWTPIRSGGHLAISHELRAGANRPGRRHLWDQFDLAVERLAYAMKEGPMSSVAWVYGEIAGLMNEIADELLDETPETRGGEL
jgi:excisionase family DNA binding protein